MITVNYFASIRETARRDKETLEIPRSVNSVEKLIEFLAERDENSHKALFGETPVLVAVNQTVVSRDYKLDGDEEIAFFPPMTGG
ncbi:MAG: molybdopterin converting factor subunit 1 [Pseudohongiellaceae bacterium]